MRMAIGMCNNRFVSTIHHQKGQRKTLNLSKNAYGKHVLQTTVQLLSLLITCNFHVLLGQGGKTWILETQTMTRVAT